VAQSASARTLPPAAESTSIERLARAFQTSDHGSVNIRSKTGLARLNDRDVHLKTSDIDLSVEAAALQVGDMLGGSDGVRSISLIGFDPARNVLVTEHVEGNSFFNVLWNSTSLLRVLGRSPTRDTARVADAPERIARWLQQFHAFSAESAAAGATPGACVEVIVDQALGKLASLERSECSTLRDRDFAAIRRFVLDTASSNNWQTLPIRRIHGDFCTVNMLMRRDGAVSILDFADCRWGFALEDFARLWCSIWEIASTGRHRHRVLTPALARLILAGGLDPRIVDTPPFQLLRAWNAITKMLEAGIKARTLPRSTRVIVNRLARAHVDWLIGAV
jgi:hypothetical protein